VFLLFYAATNGLGGSPKLSLSTTQGTPLLQLSFVFFWEVLSCLLLQLILQIEMLFGIYVVVFNFVQISTKNLNVLIEKLNFIKE